MSRQRSRPSAAPEENRRSHVSGRHLAVPEANRLSQSRTGPAARHEDQRGSPGRGRTVADSEDSRSDTEDSVWSEEAASTGSYDSWIGDYENEIKSRQDDRGKDSAAAKIQARFRGNATRAANQKMTQHQRKLLAKEFENLGVVRRRGRTPPPDDRDLVRLQTKRVQPDAQHVHTTDLGMGVAIAQIKLTPPPIEGEESLEDLEEEISTVLIAFAGLGDIDWHWEIRLVPGTYYGFIKTEGMRDGEELLRRLNLGGGRPFPLARGHVGGFMDVVPTRRFREWQAANRRGRQVHGGFTSAAVGTEWRNEILDAARRRLRAKPGLAPHEEYYKAPRSWDVEVVIPIRGGPPHIVYHCHHNGGIGNSLVMFLGCAERALAHEFDYVHFDPVHLPLYGDVSALFPDVPTMWFGAPQPCDRLGKWGFFANGRGMIERCGPLNKEDLIIGRHTAHRVLHLQADVQRSLMNFARSVRLWEALGVHVRRTDKSKDAASKFYMSPAEAASEVLRQAKKVQAERVYLAADDAVFLTAMSESIADKGLPCITWGSRLSQRPGKASHHDHNIPGLEKAVDALADCFLLSLCRGMICTYSSLSVVATLWADEGFTVKHFDGCIW